LEQRSVDARPGRAYSRCQRAGFTGLALGLLGHRHRIDQREHDDEANPERQDGLLRRAPQHHSEKAYPA